MPPRYLPYCHFLSQDDFEAVRDHTVYLGGEAEPITLASTGTKRARRPYEDRERQEPRSGTWLLTWAFPVERVRGIEPPLSAWEDAPKSGRTSTHAGAVSVVRRSRVTAVDRSIPPAIARQSHGAQPWVGRRSPRSGSRQTCRGFSPGATCLRTAVLHSSWRRGRFRGSLRCSAEESTAPGDLPLPALRGRAGRWPGSPATHPS